MWGKRSLRAILTVLVLVPASWLGACSAPSNTREVTAVQDGTLPGVVHVAVLYTSRTLFRSDSGSSHWVLDDRGEIVIPQLDEPAYGPERTEACAGDDCYRVVPGHLRVEYRHGDAGSYTVAWQVTGDTYRQLADDHRNLGDPAAHLSSRSIVVHAVAGGHVVFVANGRDGVLYRDVGGRWHRLGTPMGGEGVYFDAPPLLATDPHPLDVAGYVVGGVVLAVVVAGATTGIVRRRSRWRQGAWTAAVAMVAGLVTLAGVHFPDVGMFPGFFYGVPLITATLVISVWLVIRREGLHVRTATEAQAPPWAG
jgi:hypothetical protein